MYLGLRERAVKPSAQPTLVRTQHLPPPAKTVLWLRRRGPAARFFVSRRVSSCCAVNRRVAVSTDAQRTAPGPSDGRCAPSAVSRAATDGPRRRRVRLEAAAEPSVHSVCPPADSGCSRLGGGAGKAGGVMGDAADRESVTVAGRAERARVVQAFPGAIPGPGQPVQGYSGPAGLRAVQQQRAAQRLGPPRGNGHRRGYRRGRRGPG
jgi:hypothetical protein